MLHLALAPARAMAQRSMYLVPVEEGFLSTHAELQLHYSRVGFDSYSSRPVNPPEVPAPANWDVLLFGADAQYAIADRFELGINIPFVTYANRTIEGLTSADMTQIGDILLHFKLRLLGDERYAVSLFSNNRLPTHSSDADRGYTVFRGGASGSGRIGDAIFGGSLFTMWYAGSDVRDLGLMGFDLFGGYTLFKMLTLELALQLMGSVHRQSSYRQTNGVTSLVLVPGLGFVYSDIEGPLIPVCLIPGVSVQPLKWLRLGLAARIALNADGRALYSGQVSLLFNVGFIFN
jgi:hypothetical protein